MTQIWQDIEVAGQLCHWWRDFDEGIITAMTSFVLLVAIAAVVVINLAWLVRVLSSRQTFRSPPRHAEDSWSVDGLPNHPYAIN
ncbi:MAG: hypothetical protein ACRDQ7_11075 [Haloechinothrix sp.]